MEHVLRMLPAKPQPAMVRHGMTAVFVGACWLIAMVIQEFTGLLGFYLLLPAIFVSSVLFDRAAGIFATLLSAALLYCSLTPSGTLLVPFVFVVPLVLYVAVGIGLAIISEGMRLAWERAVAAERDKDLLYQELTHRTKNNLTIIISLLSLQARSKMNPEVRIPLEKAVARIQAIAGAHDHLEPSRHGERVEMQPYLEQLCNHLGDTLREVRPIALDVEIADVHLTTKQAIPLGLIVNELVTNSFKHAFPDERAGIVKVRLAQSSPIALTVEDNGVGCASTKPERLGSRIMQLLAQQLGATVNRQSTDRGCRVHLEFRPT